ncbi:hypothetical protein L9F63_011355, partial [Diploptera punctata]
MWSPTHVQVTVQRARGLLTKGKHGTNDAFVTIALGKEKFQTSVKEKAAQEVDWHEECELQIPKQGNVAEIVLTALHRNFLGVDEFLGVANIPLADFDVYERPRNRWYELKSKPGKEKNKKRGELEVKIAFTVKSGSLTDLSKKSHKSSLGQLSHMAQSVGGSLLSIGSIEKRKGLKKLAKSLAQTGNITMRSSLYADIRGSPYFSSPFAKLEAHKMHGEFRRTPRQVSRQVAGDADPGVISEDEDEFTFDDLSHKSSGSSINTNHNSTVTPISGSLENLAGGELLPNPLDEWEQKLYGNKGKDAGLDTLKRRSWDKPLLFSQPEEVPEPEPVVTPKDLSAPPSRTLTPVSSSVSSSPAPTTPVPAPRKMEVEELDMEKEKHREDEKEKIKEGSRLARKFKQFRKESKLVEMPNSDERIIIGGENEGSSVISPPSRLPPEILNKFEGKSREDLIEMICSLQISLEHQSKKLRDLEDYLDNLLLRVMETTPRILQNPYVNCKTQAHLRIMH